MISIFQRSYYIELKTSSINNLVVISKEALKRPSLLLIVPLLSLSSFSVFAAPPSQQERLGEERVETIVASPSSTDLPTDESVRFHISQITIENQAERFRFLERIARPYKTFCQNTEFLLYPTVFLHQLSRLANAVNQGAEFRNHVLF